MIENIPSSTGHHWFLLSDFSGWKNTFAMFVVPVPCMEPDKYVRTLRPLRAPQSVGCELTFGKFPPLPTLHDSQPLSDFRNSLHLKFNIFCNPLTAAEICAFCARLTQIRSAYRSGHRHLRSESKAAFYPEYWCKCTPIIFLISSQARLMA